MYTADYTVSVAREYNTQTVHAFDLISSLCNVHVDALTFRGENVLEILSTIFCSVGSNDQHGPLNSFDHFVPNKQYMLSSQQW